MIYQFKDFEDVYNINESILYFSPKLRKILSGINNPISRDLSNLELLDIKPDITFVDIGEEGYFNYLTMKNVKKKIAEFYPGNDGILKLVDVPDNILSDSLIKYRYDDLFNKKSIVKVGRLVNQLLPNKYSKKEVEDFVNILKSKLENQKESFQIVSGEDIRYWYNANNYESEYGTLGKSCMRYLRCQEYLSIYVKNPEVCQLVILTENEKLKGRALLWKVDNKEFEYFLDRIYTIEDKYVEKFKDYAHTNKWGTKYGDSILYDGIIIYNDLSIQLKKNSDNYDYYPYPYMDTFVNYDINNGILYTDDSEQEDGFYILNDTYGGFEEFISGEYSRYYEEVIPSDDAYFSEFLDDIISISRSVVIRNGEHTGRWPNDHEDIIFSNYYQSYVHLEDCYEIEMEDGTFDYLLREDCIDVVSVIYTDGDCNSETLVSENDSRVIYIDKKIEDSKYPISNLKWFKFLNKKFVDWRHKVGIFKNLLTTNSNGDYIPIMLKINTFIVQDEDIYLSKEDAYILNKKLNLNTKKVMDKVEYNELIYLVYKLDDELIKSYIKILNNNKYQLKLFNYNDEEFKSNEERKDKLRIRYNELLNNMFIKED